MLKNVLIYLIDDIENELKIEVVRLLCYCYPVGKAAYNDVLHSRNPQLDTHDALIQAVL